jgi:hypothetical protein
MTLKASDEAIQILDAAFAVQSGEALHEAIKTLIEMEVKDREDVLRKPAPDANDFYKANGAILSLENLKSNFAEIYKTAKEEG